MNRLTFTNKNNLNNYFESHSCLTYSLTPLQLEKLVAGKQKGQNKVLILSFKRGSHFTCMIPDDFLSCYQEETQQVCLDITLIKSCGQSSERHVSNQQPLQGMHTDPYLHHLRQESQMLVSCLLLGLILSLSSFNLKNIGSDRQGWFLIFMTTCHAIPTKSFF